MKSTLTTETYREEMKAELDAILRYWNTRMIDEQQGGFYGQIDGEEQVHADAPKGVVLNSRILWAFSAAARATGSPAWRAMADRAYDYFVNHFIDRQYGGVYWSLDARGQLLNGRKQIYGLAFSLYGLSEYYRATGREDALGEAKALFRLMEEKSYDPQRKGYYEAFARDWTPLEDLRLSPKDANERKTMNTHLHVVEAYANLYQACPDPLLRERIGGLLDVFDRYMVDSRNGHLILFFDEDWTVKSDLLSYGHDIEAAWLLLHCAEVTGDTDRIKKMRRQALRIANAAAEGLDKDGGLWYEKEGDLLVGEKHSWPQAEAMIGFLNAWLLSGEDRWLERSFASWEFVKKYIKDPVHGEWHWGIQADHRPMPGQDKAGFWKCPYHNSRACLEIMERLQE